MMDSKVRVQRFTLKYLLTINADSPFPLSPWMNVGPLYPEPEVYESGTTPESSHMNWV